MKNRIKKQFENFWKIYQIRPAFTSNDKKRIYEIFLDGYGCAVINNLGKKSLGGQNG